MGCPECGSITPCFALIYGILGQCFCSILRVTCLETRACLTGFLILNMPLRPFEYHCLPSRETTPPLTSRVMNQKILMRNYKVCLSVFRGRVFIRAFGPIAIIENMEVRQPSFQSIECFDFSLPYRIHFLFTWNLVWVNSVCVSYSFQKSTKITDFRLFRSSN